MFNELSNAIDRYRFIWILIRFSLLIKVVI